MRLSTDWTTRVALYEAKEDEGEGRGYQFRGYYCQQHAEERRAHHAAWDFFPLKKS